MVLIWFLISERARERFGPEATRAAWTLKLKFSFYVWVGRFTNGEGFGGKRND